MVLAVCVFDFELFFCLGSLLFRAKIMDTVKNGGCTEFCLLMKHGDWLKYCGEYTGLFFFPSTTINLLTYLLLLKFHLAEGHSGESLLSLQTKVRFYSAVKLCYVFIGTLCLQISRARSSPPSGVSICLSDLLPLHLTPRQIENLHLVFFIRSCSKQCPALR